MSEAKVKVDFLNVRRLPGRIHTDQVAVLSGFGEHDIPVLVRHKLLRPLGKPMPNSVKWFSTSEILEKLADRDWLDDATKVVAKHWANQNEKRKNNPAPRLGEEPVQRQAA
jgi:hypothetical protein